MFIVSVLYPNDEIDVLSVRACAVHAVYCNDGMHCWQRCKGMHVACWFSLFPGGRFWVYWPLPGSLTPLHRSQWVTWVTWITGISGMGGGRSVLITFVLTAESWRKSSRYSLVTYSTFSVPVIRVTVWSIGKGSTPPPKKWIYSVTNTYCH